MKDAPNSSNQDFGTVSSWRRAVGALAATALAFALAASAQAAEKLGSSPVDPTQVSVAGISSGAFMANQLHIAHSADIMGAAMIAGGLYGCAVEAVEDDGVRALASQAVIDCMRLPDNLKDASGLCRSGEAIRRQGLDRSDLQPRAIESLLFHGRLGRGGQFADRRDGQGSL